MATDVSAIIDNARFNRYHLRIVALCALMILFDGFDLTSISFVAPEFIEYLGVDRASIGPVFSAGLVGLTLGALGFGLLGDRWGVKRAFIFCGVMFGVFSLLTAFAQSLTVLLVYRFLAGLALGGASPISIAIASDYVPKRVRTSVVMIMYISLAVGQIAAGYSYGWLSFLGGWRTVLYIGGLAPILLAPLFIVGLPEALEYLVMHGAAPARINAILARLEPGSRFTDTSFLIARENKPGFQPVQLFQDGRAAITGVLWAVFFTSLIAIYFFNNWIPTLLTGGGLSGSEIIVVTTALPFGGVVGTFIAAPIVMRLGGFLTVSLGYLCAAAAMVVLGSGRTGFVFLAVGTLAVGVFLIGTQSALNASCASIYPPSMRATGVGWGFGIGRIGAILSPAIASYLIALKWQPSDLFLIAAVPTLAACLGAALVLRLVLRRARAPADGRVTFNAFP
jgi:MFS transporter, AAHS family, 4-hydroxybenzoate transporter